MVTLARRAARVPFAPVVAAMFALVAAILVLAAPVAVLESGVVASGLPGLLPPAAPPLGNVARVMLAVLAALVTGGLLWAILTPIVGILEGRKPSTPWRDAGYDKVAEAPDSPIARRRPIFATNELGAPLMSDEVLELSVPAEPEPEVLAHETFEAPAWAAEAPTTVEPLAAPLAIGEFAPEVAGRVEDDTSIAALIRRLEDGLARRRAANDPGPDAPAPAPVPVQREWRAQDDASVTHELPNNDDDDGTMQQALAALRRMVRR